MVTQGRQVGKKEDTPNYKDAQDAKHLLDQIGEKIQDIANAAALPYNNALHGTLSQATFSNNHKINNNDPCKLNYEFDTYVTSNVIEPCKYKSEERFSEVHGSECDNKKIRDSDKKNKGGACAPFRRLHVCDKNIEQIDPAKITATHNLLVDVCQAAKYEGQSIRGYYAQYDAEYPSGSSFTTCTALARSFADIGDIVRGKDLYRGDKKKDQQEREKLEQKLKEIFKKIHDNLKDKKAKDHYKDDGPDYFQLREDWWDANRAKVWEAITCKAEGASYFRKTCGSGPDAIRTPNQCRCGTYKVPTYFDYVPQYLRWFEEWAEDFCRKRKKKIENAIKNCRGDDGKKRYCDLNGFDCEKTAKGKNQLVEGADCKKCSVACNPFVEWLDNQQKEFLKQKNKYDKEIKKAEKKKETSITIGNTTINNLYVGDFYEQLRENYGKVEDFLQKLNDETTCKGHPEVGEEKADAANFTKGNVDKTFSRTKYCRACPLCGVTGEKGNWKDKGDGDCGDVKQKKKYPERNTTTIPVLTAEKRKRGILQKYSKFCDSVKNNANGANGGGQIKNWECHYEQTDKSNICVLQHDENDKAEEDVMSYYSFFYGSIIDMLNDSIDWKDKLKYCIEKAEEGICRRVCKEYCECYKRWVEKKQTEWTQIKNYFLKQEDLLKDMKGDLFQHIDPDSFLEYYLKSTFLEDMIKAQGDPKVIEKFKEILGKENEDDLPNFLNGKRIIDDFLEKEKQKADKCLQTHTNPCPQPSTPAGGGGVARSETHEEKGPPHADGALKPEEDDDDDDSDEDEVEEESAEAEALPTQDATEEVGPKEEGPDVCKIVGDALTNNDTLKQACPTKYGPKAPTSWKCVPTSGGADSTTREGSSVNGDRSQRAKREAPSGAVTATGGSICVPPRRRRLYVGKLEEWASDKVANTETSVSPQAANTQAANTQAANTQAANTQEGESQTLTGGEPQVSTQASTSPSSNPRADGLVKAFVESAAIETFFLWHEFKEQWRLQQEEERKRNGDLLSPFPGLAASKEMKALPSATPLPSLPGTDNDNPQNKLEKGEIPEDFLRQMFYTLGDYRDICVGKTPDGIDTVSASDKDTKGEEKSKMTTNKISTKIKEFLQKQNSDTAGSSSGRATSQTGTHSPSSDKDPESWWQAHGPAIWDGMVCALGYNTENRTKDDNVHKQLMEAIKNNSKYDYHTVIFSSVGPSAGAKLDEFSRTPQYFRWFQEWGETFCKKRTEMLEKIKYECRSDKVCSGDGENCNDNLPDNPSTFPSFNCPSCGKHCRWYKRWIRRKKDEFTKHSNVYNEQKEKAKNNNNNGFCGKLEENAAAFLNKLKSGPCKKDKENVKDELDFDKPNDTFRPATNCAPCSEFKVKCKNGVCTGGVTKGNCNGGTITEKDIEKMNDLNGNIDMLVSDDNPNGNKFDDLPVCEGKGIFKGIRKDVWKCGKVCGYNVCKPVNVNDLKVNGTQNQNQIIIITALVKRWLEYFFDDYNKINKKLNICIENGKGSTCIKDCVDTWIKEKSKEWQQITERLNEQYKNDKQPDYSVTTILEELIPKIDVTIDKRKVTQLSDLQKTLKCNCAKPSKEKVGKQDNNQDAIDCMIKKLQEKATSCLSLTSDSQEKPCVDSPSPIATSPEEEDLVLEETENQVDPPKICPKQTVEDKKKEEGEEKCEAAPTPKKPAAEPERTEKAKPPEPEAPPAATP
ncbi:hypothetical protein PFMALIP_03736, partial [Plasmodium falciparum MaliPS096_E11]